MTTRVAPSLRPLDHHLVSQRHARAARKWPWAWWCTACDEGVGAAKTADDAQRAADEHTARRHPTPSEETL
ncbi:hypothetical protein [Streptomyces sp. NPDC047097]|uniref:hypothetical protein n=1 Tax=Streptomyces sp. NPDC047097 TaxID=3155260 RepID=UPI0033C5DD16